MVAGHLQEKKGYFYIVLSYPGIREKKDKVDTHKPARKGQQEKSGKAVNGSAAGIKSASVYAGSAITSNTRNTSA